MSKTSPTSRTLQLLKRQGYISQVVEKFNPWAKVRIDLFGFIDIVCLCPGKQGVLGIQATSTSNISSRREKIKSIETSKAWIEAGNRIMVIGWSKKGGKNQRKLWQPKMEELINGKWKSITF